MAGYLTSMLAAACRIFARLAPGAVPLLWACAVSAAGLPLRSSFGPGAHDWAYWDTTIQDVLAWLPLESPPAD